MSVMVIFSILRISSYREKIRKIEIVIKQNLKVGNQKKSVKLKNP